VLAYVNRGRVYLDKGDLGPRPSLADHNEAVQIEPQNVAALEARGITYTRLGQLDNAIADFTAALTLNPKHFDALYGLGFVKLKKGDIPGRNADIAAAKAVKTDIAERMAEIGLK